MARTGEEAQGRRKPGPVRLGNTLLIGLIRGGTTRRCGQPQSFTNPQQPWRWASHPVEGHSNSGDL